MKHCVTKIIRSFILIIVLMSSANAITDTWLANGSVVHDVATGLVWQRQDDGVRRNFSNAILYCQGLELADNSQWRLPNVKELMSIVDYRTEIPAIDESAFRETQPTSYWSTSIYALGSDRAWVVNFYDGFIGFAGDTESYYVRCVR